MAGAVTLDALGDLLLVVDVQNDFCPGGAAFHPGPALIPAVVGDRFRPVRNRE